MSRARRDGKRLIYVALLSLNILMSGCTAQRKNGVGTSVSSRSNTLRMAVSIEPPTLDPAKVQDIPTNIILSHVFEGLVRYNEKNVIEPVLASAWDLSPDGKIYTFHIRSDVHFHNGRLFTAEDVKYSWERALSPKTDSGVAANYLDGIVGAKDVAVGKRTDLPGVVVMDAQTLKVTLDHARAFFLGMISYPSGWIVCREAVAKTDGKVGKGSMIGTGPFQWDSYKPGLLVTLKANPSYWNGKPLLDSIEFPIIINSETVYNNFETGQLDIADVSNARIAQDRAAGKFNKEYHVIPEAALNYLVMQPEKQPVFANILVRKAFAEAIDRAKLLKIADNGIGTVANGILPPDLPGKGTEPQPIPYNPAEARKFLAQAGYPEGRGFPTLTLTYTQNSPANRAAGGLIRDDLRNNLGVTINLQELEAGQYFAQERKKELEFCFANWIADYPDPQNFLSTLFVSTASLNRSSYHNLEFDKLCTAADAEQNPSRRADLYGKANQIIMQDVGVLPLSFGPHILLVHENVLGWQANLCKLLPFTRAKLTTN